MEAVHTAEPLPTFEQFMASMKELRESQKETDRELKENARRMQEGQEKFDREMQESRQKFDRELQERRQEFDRQVKEDNKRFSEFSNRFGEIVEHMVIPNLVDKFDELGFTFTKANRTAVKDKKHDLFFEVDALLENGDKVMAVEIKSKPNMEDIHYHLERMEKLRQYADLHDDRRVYLGAMAGVVFSDSLKIYSLKHGLYVIEPSGETFNITIPEGKYHPREW